ncbi:MAG: HAD family phosphatase [Candidatus Aminicenantes bacterium]|nr:HAD family phosphatase [Candidatus Aminicenantes bacterium]
MAVEAIIFDFGNVICSLDNNIFLRRIAEFTPKSFVELRRSVYEESRLPWLYETGEIDSRCFFEGIVELCDLKISEEEFIRAYTGIFTPIPATFDLIKSLKPNYKLGLLSNTSEWDFEYGIKPIEVFDLFDAVSLSYEVKVMKPGAKIFEDMLDKLGMEPGRCVFFDDIEENAAGARRVGMAAFLYSGHQTLLAGLKSLGVEV